MYDIAAVIEAPRPPRSLAAREAADGAIAHLLERAEPDWIILSAYRYILTRPMLDRFPQRIIAFHDADLTVRDEAGNRRYTGLHAVRDAFLEGDLETRASAFIVTEKIGEGPLFLLSAPYRAGGLVADAQRWGSADLLIKYASLHREWMVRSAYGPMLLRLVEMLAAGEIRIVGDVVWVDGAPGPCRMGEAPSACRATPAEGIPHSCPFMTSH